MWWLSFLGGGVAIMEATSLAHARLLAVVNGFGRASSRFDVSAMWQGGKSPGAPKGNTNAFKHGRCSAETIEARRKIAALLRTMRTVVRASRQADAL